MHLISFWVPLIARPANVFSHILSVPYYKFCCLWNLCSPVFSLLPLLSETVCPVVLLALLYSHHFRPAVLTSVVTRTKRLVFWDIPTCSPLKVSKPSGGTCNFCIHGSGRQQAVHM
jgi:hypothetical protein